MHLVDIAPHEAGAVAGAGKQAGALPDALKDPRQIMRVEVYTGRDLPPRLAQKVRHLQGPAEIHGIAHREQLKLAMRPGQSVRKLRTLPANS